MATLQILFIVLAALIVLYWMIYAVTGPAKIERPDVLHVLRYGRVLRSAALFVALGPPLAMAGFIWIIPWKSPQMLALGGGSFMVLSALAGLWLLEVEGSQVALSEEGITRFFRSSQPITLKWAEIDSVGYSTLNRWFIVKAGERKLNISRHLVGIDTFVVMARQKIAAERLADAAAAIDLISRSGTAS